MKNILQFFSFIIFILIACVSNYAQTIETGTIAIAVDDFGRIRVLSPDASTRQIDRSSILIGGDVNQIFNYNSDSESIDTVRTIETSTIGDIEVYVKYDNSYSGEKPDAEIAMNVYGWNDANYVIVKQSIKNLDAETKTLHPGMEILPQVDGAYGFDIIQLSEMGLVKVDAGDGTTKTGYKYLSHELVGLNSIEWFDGYDSTDVDFYNWFMQDNLTERFEAGSDGAVAMMRAESITLGPDESVDVYLAVAVGADSSELVASIENAIQKYDGAIVSVELVDNKLPQNFDLSNNYPNPFNPTTNIEFSLPVKGLVNLSVFNLLGQMVSELANNEMAPGKYSYNFDASNLSSGIYYYTLTAGNYSSTKKMMLIK